MRGERKLHAQQMGRQEGADAQCLLCTPVVASRLSSSFSVNRTTCTGGGGGDDEPEQNPIISLTIQPNELLRGETGTGVGTAADAHSGARTNKSVRDQVSFKGLSVAW